MGRRRRVFHFLALPLGLWFLALFTDVGGVDACPMDQVMDHVVAVARADLAMPHTPQLLPAPAGPAAPLSHAPLACNCIGTCAGSAMATLPAAPPVPALSIVSSHGAALLVRADLPRAAAAAYLLPPSIGPPSRDV